MVSLKLNLGENLQEILFMLGIQDNIYFFSPWLSSQCELWGIQIWLQCRHDSWAAILIRQVGTGSDDNKNEGILLQRLVKRQASVKNNENQGL